MLTKAEVNISSRNWKLCEINFAKLATQQRQRKALLRNTITAEKNLFQGLESLPEVRQRRVDSHQQWNSGQPADDSAEPERQRCNREQYCSGEMKAWGQQPVEEQQRASGMTGWSGDSHFLNQTLTGENLKNKMQQLHEFKWRSIRLREGQDMNKLPNTKKTKELPQMRSAQSQTHISHNQNDTTYLKNLPEGS